MQLTRPQSELFTSEAKATAMVSGFGAGKTAAAITRMLATKFLYPEVNLLYCAPTYSLIRDILYPEISEALNYQGFEEGRDFIINRSTSASEIVFNGAGKILCRTMDNPSRIVGFQVGDAFLDEFDTLPTEKAEFVWVKVLARIRKHFPDGKKNQIYVTTTPEGFKATYKLFQKEAREDYKLIKASTLSNPHLPSDYVDTLRQAYPEQLIEAYINGEFVNLTTGTVYYAFSREHHSTKYVQAPREMLHIGMDFNVYKMAAIVHIIRDRAAYAVDELIDLRDTNDMIVAIKEKYPEHPIVIYPDSSGKAVSPKSITLSDHKLLRDAGFRLRAKKSNPLIKDRVLSVNTAFEKGKYYVNTARCQFYTECLEQQVYDKTGKPEKDGVLDNPLDAGGYFINWQFPVHKPEFKQTTIQGFF